MFGQHFALSGQILQYTLVRLRGPGRARVGRRNDFRLLAVGIGLWIEARDVLFDGSCLKLRRRPVGFLGRHAVIAAGVGLDHAGIDREALTLDQARVHARTHHSFEDLAQDVAVTEAAVTIDRKRRVVRNLVVKVEPTEPRYAR